MLTVPRIVIAGTNSGVGKTTITTGLMVALTELGLKVQGFKVGPDYIDPSYHTKATGRNSINLDPWLLGEDGVRELFQRNAQAADIAVIEGVMGLFDGVGGEIGLGSTAQVAKILEAPVVLVINAKSMSGSIAAIVKGFCDLDPEVLIKGIILNRVASDQHQAMLQMTIQKYNQLPIAGVLRNDAVQSWTERHLGLVPVHELPFDNCLFQELGHTIAENLDLSLILEFAKSAGPLAIPPTVIYREILTSEPKVRIAYAYDAAFNFYYQDNLALLKHYGAELVPVSPLNDQCLPADIHGMLIGGGFPESFLASLSANTSFQKDLKAQHAKGLPIYAECGGMMYLTQAIVDFEGQEFPMVGLLPGKCKMTKRLAALGYYQGQVLQDNLLFFQNTTIKGHEFHYSELVETPSQFPWVYALNKRAGTPTRLEGYTQANLLASYLHLHFASNPSAAENLIKHCQNFLNNCNM